MLRAGFWDLNPGFCRSACRNHHLPDFFIIALVCEWFAYPTRAVLAYR
jgi:hypothetical protein